MHGLSKAFEEGTDLQRWVNELIELSGSYSCDWFHSALELFEKIDKGGR
jgi:hypothetical protein